MRYAHVIPLTKSVISMSWPLLRHGVLSSVVVLSTWLAGVWLFLTATLWRGCNTPNIIINLAVLQDQAHEILSILPRAPMMCRVHQRGITVLRPHGFEQQLCQRYHLLPEKHVPLSTVGHSTAHSSHVCVLWLYLDWRQFSEHCVFKSHLAWKISPKLEPGLTSTIVSWGLSQLQILLLWRCYN